MPDPTKVFNLKITGKTAGEVNNTEEVIVDHKNTFFIFTDSASAYPGAGTATHNGFTSIGWDNIDGGKDGTVMQVRYYIDRNGVTSTGINVTATLQVWGILEEDGMDPITYYVTKQIDSDTDTDANLSSYILNAFLNGPCFDNNGNATNVQSHVYAVNESGNVIISPYSYSDGYAWIFKSKNINHAISGNIFQSGKVTLTKFEQLPAFSSPGFDVITKDIDFGYPGVRKKVHKVIVTYKAPYDMQAAYNLKTSNVHPFYAVNGRTRLQEDKFAVDWKDVTIDKDTSIVNGLPSTSQIGGQNDFRWKRVELTPRAGNSEWNNIYSFAMRFKTIDSEETKGFEINDISIVYRIKSPK